MQQSPLHSRHVELKARFLPFAGWEMPIQYEGIVAEHKAVRDAVGVFDISHMGELIVSGAEATSWLNTMLTNDVGSLRDGEGQYTLMLNESGGVIDDLILYREAEDRYFLVVNASKIAEDIDWLQKHCDGDVSLENQSESWGGLAVQGPASVEIWKTLRPDLDLPERNGIVRHEEGWIACRTGYTGEDGFELFDTNEAIGNWFDQFLEAGVTPCGLGARDTLRLEKCYPLNGSDLDEKHTPLEAGLGFFVKLEKEAVFTGRSSLIAQKKEGIPNRLAAIRMTGKAPPPRQGYEIRADTGNPIGELSSGSLSPSLGTGIGMAYLPAAFTKPGQEVVIVIRDREFPAVVVKKPFL
ncbi:MAG: glycine cleavage system aminomethyltransferase GcvT [Verrucomicrobiales bacterium]|nr:glycine cleavage system aminomethyltransferase GcvT [Verrucomicrobiales bacterium]